MPLDEYDPRRGRQGRPWRRLVEQLCPPGSLCRVDRCRVEAAGGTRAIRHDLRPRHRLGPSLHHLVSPLDGGHPTAAWNLVPAHLGCNSSIGRPGHSKNAPRRMSRAFPVVDRSSL